MISSHLFRVLEGSSHRSNHFESSSHVRIIFESSIRKVADEIASLCSILRNMIRIIVHECLQLHDPFASVIRIIVVFVLKWELIRTIQRTILNRIESFESLVRVSWVRRLCCLVTKTGLI